MNNLAQAVAAGTAFVNRFAFTRFDAHVEGTHEIQLLAHRGAVTVGSIAFRPEIPSGYFRMLSVAEDCRKQGVATALIREVERIAIEMGFEGVSCTVQPKNMPARKLYAKLGYFIAYKYHDGDYLMHRRFNSIDVAPGQLTQELANTRRWLGQSTEEINRIKAQRDDLAAQLTAARAENTNLMSLVHNLTVEVQAPRKAESELNAALTEIQNLKKIIDGGGSTTITGALAARVEYLEDRLAKARAERDTARDENEKLTEEIRKLMGANAQLKQETELITKAANRLHEADKATIAELQKKLGDEARSGEIRAGNLSADLREERAVFKAFHSRLCQRFGYAHDEKDWRRDLMSLEEHLERRMNFRAEDYAKTIEAYKADWALMTAAVDALATKCGFPISENRPQMLETVGKRLDRLTAEQEEAIRGHGVVWNALRKAHSALKWLDGLKDAGVAPDVPQIEAALLLAPKWSTDWAIVPRLEHEGVMAELNKLRDWYTDLVKIVGHDRVYAAYQNLKANFDAAENRIIGDRILMQSLKADRDDLHAKLAAANAQLGAEESLWYGMRKHLIGISWNDRANAFIVQKAAQAFGNVAYDKDPRTAVAEALKILDAKKEG